MNREQPARKDWRDPVAKAVGRALCCDRPLAKDGQRHGGECRWHEPERFDLTYQPRMSPRKAIYR